MNQKATRKDWIAFTLVMLVFLVGMIFMLINKVHDPWVWTGYVALWTWVEMKIAKNIHLRWWVWALILLGLGLLDLVIIKLIH